MRILFVDQFSHLGGAQMVLRDIMAEARDRGWDSWFAAPGNGDLFSFCRASGIKTQSLPPGSYRNGSKSLWNIARYAFDISRSANLIEETVRRHRIDVIYANGPRILAAASACGRPLVFHLHSALDKIYSRAIVRQALKRSPSTVIAASQFVAKAFKPAVTRDSLRVIYNGVRDFGFEARPQAERVPTIAIVGRIAPEKGHLDFVRAAGLLSERGHRARFLIVGAALHSDPAYGDKVNRAAAGGNVEFRGWTDDVATLLHEIDILVAPCSGNECSPRILIEAFSAGTPVVAYPSGGIPELIQHGKTGLLTANTGHEALAAAIEQLLRNRPLTSKLSANGRREWETRFRIERFRNDIAAVIERRCDVKGRQAKAASTVACEEYLSSVRAPHR